MPAKHATQRIERDSDFSSSGALPSRANTSEASALFLVGLACMAAGVAISVLPRFSWQAKQIAGLLDQLGVHGGAIAIGGLVLMGVARVRRQLSAMEAQGASNEDLLFEQVASDMVQTRNALEHLQTLASGMQAEIGGLSGEVMRLASQPPPAPPPAPVSGNDDAIYGLAASLDKLGARIEQRLKAQHDALQDNFEEMNASLVRWHRLLEESSAAAATVAQPEPTVQFAQPDAASVTEELQPELNSLGLLDTLDDYGTSESLPPAVSASAQDTNALDELRRHLESDIAPATAGGGSWEEELNMVEAPSMPSKLDQLRALLADEEVRAALESWTAGKPRSAA